MFSKIYRHKPYIFGIGILLVFFMPTFVFGLLHAYNNTSEDNGNSYLKKHFVLITHSLIINLNITLIM